MIVPGADVLDEDAEDDAADTEGALGAPGDFFLFHLFTLRAVSELRLALLDEWLVCEEASEDWAARGLEALCFLGGNSTVSTITRLFIIHFSFFLGQ